MADEVITLVSERPSVTRGTDAEPLITQRSRVQILPPLHRKGPEPNKGGGLSHVPRAAVTSVNDASAYAPPVRVLSLTR
jgi:hypothetical protein